MTDVYDLEGQHIASVAPRDIAVIRDGANALKDTHDNNFDMDDVDFDAIGFDISKIFTQIKTADDERALISSLVGGVA